MASTHPATDPGQSNNYPRLVDHLFVVSLALNRPIRDSIVTYHICNDSITGECASSSSQTASDRATPASAPRRLSVSPSEQARLGLPITSFDDFLNQRRNSKRLSVSIATAARKKSLAGAINATVQGGSTRDARDLVAIATNRPNIVATSVPSLKEEGEEEETYAAATTATDTGPRPSATNPRQREPHPFENKIESSVVFKYPFEDTAKAKFPTWTSLVGFSTASN